MHGLADLAAVLNAPRHSPPSRPLHALQTKSQLAVSAHSDGLEKAPAGVDYGLTQSESAVLSLAAKGLQNAEIARQRSVSVGTVKAQMHRIFEKLGTRSRFEAALLYRVALGGQAEDRQRAEDGDFDFSWLNQVALTAERKSAGTVLFRQGEGGDRLYFIVKGRVRLVEKPGTVLGPRDLIGEIAVLAPGHRRTLTAVCETDASLLSMDREQVRRCYRVYPQFAIYILFSIIRRLMADRQQ